MNTTFMEMCHSTSEFYTIQHIVIIVVMKLEVMKL